MKEFIPGSAGYSDNLSKHNPFVLSADRITCARIMQPHLQGMMCVSGHGYDAPGDACVVRERGRGGGADREQQQQ